MLVMMTAGVDDLDFGDGGGTVYAGGGVSFSATSGAVGLYGPSTIVDFVSWDDPYDDVDFVEGPTQLDAVSSRIWTRGDYFQTAQLSPDSRPRLMLPGSSIARDGQSTDTNDDQDFSVDGVDASDAGPI